jgi:hypothetical protein
MKRDNNKKEKDKQEIFQTTNSKKRKVKNDWEDRRKERRSRRERNCF